MESWLKGLEATGLDSLAIADFPLTGRGIQTRRSFKQWDQIFTIPKAALWTVKQAQADPLIGSILRTTQPPLSIENIFIIYILFVRSRQTGYEGQRTHVAALPQSYSSSIFFTEEELDVCQGSSLYDVTKQLDQQIQNDYRELVISVFARHPDLFPLDVFTIDSYKWGLCTIWSRGMDFQQPGGESIRLLAPFADMLNHSPDAKQCHAYDFKSGDLTILAGKGYEAGDQVYIYYGAIPNNRLLRLYGFVIPDNPHDSYDLVLSTNPMAPLYEQKLKLWDLTGLGSDPTIPLTLTNQLPDKVLQYLRIQRLDTIELASIAPQRANAGARIVSQRNESEVLNFLIESISCILDNFGKQGEMIEESLAHDTYPVGSNAWAAAHVSLGEQRVLRLAKKKALSLLATVEEGRVGAAPSSVSAPALCAKCGKDSGPLSLCGRCKAVRYCGRECQVSHHKEHKPICQAIASRR
ncbi:hypothetical protein GGR57DRAFT_341016 [Xylariaceae sp. FL1272]|nr:hypothetical protein GGR57DRAFT_341016 [Xylariaceae sp. FL1272]